MYIIEYQLHCSHYRHKEKLNNKNINKHEYKFGTIEWGRHILSFTTLKSIEMFCLN